jgi:hypothetical protein
MLPNTLTSIIVVLVAATEDVQPTVLRKRKSVPSDVNDEHSKSSVDDSVNANLDTACLFVDEPKLVKLSTVDE